MVLGRTAGSFKPKTEHLRPREKRAAQIHSQGNQSKNKAEPTAPYTQVYNPMLPSETNKLCPPKCFDLNTLFSIYEYRI
jgi:hypothetical protein